MKKVRFETHESGRSFGMADSECHSPRPFIEQHLRTSPVEPPYEFTRVLPYNNDPVHRYDSSNSSPYPTVIKTRTSLPGSEPNWKPSDDLDLSFLDVSHHEPRQPAFRRADLQSTFENKTCGYLSNDVAIRTKPQVLSAIKNNVAAPPNVLIKDSFFIRRDNLDKYNTNNPLHYQFKGLSLGKENNPLVMKAEMMNGVFKQSANTGFIEPPLKTTMKDSKSHVELPKDTKPVIDDHCQCHHCVKQVENVFHSSPRIQKEAQRPAFQHTEEPFHSPPVSNLCHCSEPPKPCSHCHPDTQPIQYPPKTCNCLNHPPAPQNAVAKKIWAIEKFEQRKQSQCMEVEKQTNVMKEKREPTVADLFKIIKLQNEQLQLLQEKVDKFIQTSKQSSPTISCSAQPLVSVNTNNEQLKMSIGVMTSFEMVRTSTVINKEVIEQTNENAQIQCNRSQISIKEVVSKPPNLNFLDGIAPVNNSQECKDNVRKQMENGDEKTFNELSLYNVQVDNTTTPNLSPDQTLYLDVRDYSESETSSNDQSNVGWTYYNKVMTHVNGMLQESQMPSSASAMFRNMRQQCVQMQIDKSNISVTKRVKFGDDPLGIHQPHIYASTDTSLKMNQLAAKYLKNPPPQRIEPKPTQPIDMSFATRNYMERHKILHGIPSSSKFPHAGEIPRFLDITALKQQPKFL